MTTGDAEGAPVLRPAGLRQLLYPGHTLPTALAPVAVAFGLATSHGVAAIGPALAAFLAGWLIQLGGVIADNYNNLRRHPDDREHPEFVQAIASGRLSIDQFRHAARVCYAGALVAGLYLVWIGGVPALVIGIASILASLAYSSDPFPLGDRALGDPLFFVFFGVVSVAGAYYVQAAAALGTPFLVGPPPGSLPASAVLVSLPVAALTTNILVIDNIRDREFDAAKGEITLAVVLGETWSRVELVLLTCLAYGVPLVLWMSGSGAPVLLPLLTLPLGAWLAVRVWKLRGHEALRPVTAQAGMLDLAFSLLFAVGLAWGGVG
ncbi:MAG: UbiA family prenyltransferase [Gemmatimonadota bacterium]